MFKLNLLKLNLLVHLRHLMGTCAAQRKFGDLIKICIVYMTSHGYPLDKLCHSGSTFAFCDLLGFILPMWHIWEKWCTCSWVLRCSNFISGLKETVFPADTWTVLHYFFSSESPNMDQRVDWPPLKKTCLLTWVPRRSAAFPVTFFFGYRWMNEW